MNRIGLIIVLAFVTGACGSAASVATAPSDSAESGAEEDAASVDPADAEEFFEDIPTEPIEPPPSGFILEPANAQIGSIDGWVDVDNWYWEPLSFEPSPDCDALNDVLLLEDWGVITTFRLKDGTELFHFTAELNTAANVAAYVDVFTSVAERCPTASFGSANVVFTPFDAAGFDGFTVVVDDGFVSSNWLLESNTASSAVIMSRNNVVSILHVVPSEGFDMAELDELARMAADQLSEVVPAGA